MIAPELIKTFNMLKRRESKPFKQASGSMAVNKSFWDYVMEQLEVVGNVSSRKLFGGVGIYTGDLFFALIGQSTLYFKVDDSTRGDFEELGMKAFQPYKDNKQTMQYYEVPIDVLEDREQIEIWANKAIEVAVRARSKKKKKK